MAAKLGPREQNIVNRMTHRQRRTWRARGKPGDVDGIVACLGDTAQKCEFLRAMIEETGSQFYARIADLNTGFDHTPHRGRIVAAQHLERRLNAAIRRRARVAREMVALAHPDDRSIIRYAKNVLRQLFLRDVGLHPTKGFRISRGGVV